VAGIATTYGLNSTQRQAVEDLRAFFAGLAGDPGSQGVFSFEVSDFGLRVSADGPTVSGDIRLVQLPRLLEILTPLTDLGLSLGSTVDKLFIAIDYAAADEPLITVPVPGDAEVEVFFTRFMLAYAWGRNEFAFALESELRTSRALDLTAGGTGVVVPPSNAFDVQLGATATVPPVPIPEGKLRFGAGPTGPSSALDDLGLQAVVGSGQTRFVTAYVRELAFSPTYFLLWPGLRGDAGLVLGGPNPKDLPDAEAFLDVSAWDRDAFFARFTVTRGTLLFLDAMQGVLLNPLAAVPPFVTANPPYWIAAPTLMGDVYADEIGVSLNLPGLAFFDLTFERPLPSFSLQALLELAALAAGGFTRPIPSGSPLRDVFVASLHVRLELELPGLSNAASAFTIGLEVNVADFINGAVDLLNKGRAVLDGTGDLLQAVTDDPDALVRMVPRDFRRLAHAIHLGGLSFSGSVHLLTAQELEDELVLFFESRRRRPRGIAANTTVPAVPGGASVNTAPVLVDSVDVNKRRLSDAHSALPDLDLVNGQGMRLARRLLAARRQQLAKLQEERRGRLARAAEAAADALKDAATRARRTAILKQLELAEAAPMVEQALSGGSGNVHRRVRDAILAFLERGDEAMVADGALRVPPEQLAGELVAAAAASGTSAARRAEVERRLPDEGKDALIGPVRAAITVFERTRAANPGAAAARLEATLVKLLSDAYAVRRDSLAELDRLVISDAAAQKLLNARAAASWRPTPTFRDRVTRVRVFDARRTGRVAALIGDERPLPDATDGMVEEVVGYEIRLREDDPSGFAVPLGAAGAAYKVQMRAGRYRLLVRDEQGGWQAHDLPAALVASIPEGLDKARRLRDELVVAPRTLGRVATTAERDAVAEQFEHHPTLYKASILAREEYEIKPTGGVHGPFTLGDLLRDPVSEEYTVPRAPALLAGFKASILGDEIGFAGIVVASEGGPDVFLHAYHDLDAAFGNLTLSTRGEFTAIAGDLWRDSPLSGGGGVADAVNFSGHLALRNGSDTMFEGQASGTIRGTEGDGWDAALSVAVAAQGTVDVGIGEVKFARLVYGFSGALAVTVSAADLAVSADTTASVTAELATYGFTEVEIVPAVTVCVSILVVDSIFPPAAHWEDMCVTTPAVTTTVPDFTTIVWAPLASADCAITATVSSTDGLDLKLELDPASELAGQIGIDRVPIPALV
jgi:hypothetical protein